MLQLGEELDEDVLRRCSSGLSEEDLAEDGVDGADTGDTTIVPLLLLDGDLLILELPNPSVVGFGREGTLVDEDEDVASFEDGLDVEADLFHVLESV